MIDQVHQFVVPSCHRNFTPVFAIDDDRGYAIGFVPWGHVHGMRQHRIDTEGGKSVEYRVPIHTVVGRPVCQLLDRLNALPVFVDSTKKWFMQLIYQVEGNKCLKATRIECP